VTDAFLLLSAFALGAVCMWLVLRTRQQPDPALTPLKESLDKVDAHLRVLEKERAASGARLDEQLRALHSETSTLAEALRTPNARGQWGEMQLRRCVELAGMTEYCDFSTQRTLESGMRPDLIVHLPSGRAVAVDAKAPLEPRRMREHIVQLASRQYWRQLEASPEFVVAFVPGESVLQGALKADPDLLEFAAERRVLPASPSTLIALLRAVAMGWREERLAESAAQISALGRELHGRLASLAGHFEDLRRSLEKSVASYNSAAGALESRVMVSARRFRDLGAAQDDIAELEPVSRALRPPAARRGGSSGEAEE
jgi:DNA recombination protein RmuC